MKIGLVLTPFNDVNLQLAAQLGVDEIVHYDMSGMPDGIEELASLRDRARQFGLGMTIVEGGPPMDLIVMGKPGRDRQIERFKRCLGNMGAAGFSVLCYSFMPWALRVARTSYSTRTRGDALTSSFDLSAWDDSLRTPDGETSAEFMWDNFEYFIRAVVPSAEAAGVRLALHPDDPPIGRLRGLSRIFGSVESFERLARIEPSPFNGMTLCQGVFAEMEEDVPNIVRRFAERIHFVHFRDVRGKRDNFVEVFQDDGNTDMEAVVRAYLEIGFQGVIRPDHVPLMAGEPSHQSGLKAPGYESGSASGYTMMGRLFAVGYMKGLIEAVRKRPFHLR